MDYKTREKYEQLKSKNQEVILQKKWEQNVLLQDCLLSLGTNTTLLSINEQKNILKVINDYVSSAICLDKTYTINEFLDLKADISDCRFFIVWDECSLPIILCPYYAIKKNINDIIAVAFDTWLVKNDFTRFIEITHEEIVNFYNRPLPN